MNPQKARVVILISGLFLLIDRILKWQALYSWSEPRLIGSYFGWQPFYNDGIAFSLSIPYQITLIFSIPIIIFVFYFLYTELKKEDRSSDLILAWSLLLGGAISNFIDRIVYRHVIDYFALATAIINIGDIMIVLGLILYLLNFKNRGSGVSS